MKSSYLLIGLVVALVSRPQGTAASASASHEAQASHNRVISHTDNFTSFLRVEFKDIEKDDGSTMMGSRLNLTVQITEDLVSIVISFWDAFLAEGESDTPVYFAVGFGSFYMEDTYSIVVEPDEMNLFEDLLGNHNSGDVLEDSFLNVTTYVMEDDITTVSILRERVVDFEGADSADNEYYYKFPFQETTSKACRVGIIYAHGDSEDEDGAELSNHGEYFGLTRMTLCDGISAAVNTKDIRLIFRTLVLLLACHICFLF